MGSPRLNAGAPISAYTRGTAESIATIAAQGTDKVVWITDFGAGSDAPATQFFVESGANVLLNGNLAHGTNIQPLMHRFGSPLRGSANVTIRIRVGSATAISWAFIAGYVV